MAAKKTLCLLLSMIMMLTVGVFSARAENEPAGTVDEAYPDLLAGDADRDGEITILDATRIQSFVAELCDMDELTQKVAKNEFSAEELTVLDATNIQRAIAELNSAKTYEVGKPAYIRKNGEYISVIDDLKQYYDDLMLKQKYFGVLYITRNGRTLVSSAYGNKTYPISIDTLFPIGSISKQFCAAAIMILRDQGKLSVDDTLEEYFPDYTAGKDITLKNLLQMRSGIPDHLNYANSLFNSGAISVDNTAAENKAAILQKLFEQPLRFKPDKTYEYSNSNFLLLSEIVEQVSGMPYSDFIRENIFIPLGMDHSGFYEDLVESEDLAPIRISDYTPLEPYTRGITHGCGDLVSCAKDLDKWMTSLHSYTILSKESVSEMSTPVSGYGYGIGADKDGCLSHTGAIAAYMSFNYINPAIGYHLFTSSTFTDYNKALSLLGTFSNGVIEKTE